MTSRMDIVQAARKYVGVPYHHQGRDRISGLDCLGLIVVVAQDLGYVLDEVPNYARVPDAERLMSEVLQHAEEVSLDAYQPGDFIIFGYNRRRKVPKHFAFVSDTGSLIQSLDPSGVRETTFDETWQTRAIYAFKFPGVASWQVS